MAAKPTPKPKKTPKGDAAVREYKKQVSPEGIAKAEAEARAALEKKYPGMFIPQNATTH